jgi:glycine cleavage system transcriptional repressor
MASRVKGAVEGLSHRVVCDAMDGNRDYMVLTAVGADRPGLVNQLSSLIRGAGASIEDSRMAILGGEFAMILLISGPAGMIERAKEIGGQAESDLGLRCILKETSPARPTSDYLLYHLEVSGADRPGIVEAIAGILAGRGINIASLESRLSYAPFSATPMFILEAALQVPSKTVLSEVRGDLATTCEDENLDFRLEPGA